MIKFIRRFNLRPADKSRRGFTLIEVLVALTIFAVSAAGLTRAMGQTLRQAHSLEDKTFAGWVAENRLAETRIATSWPDTGDTTAEVSLAGRMWKVRTRVMPTTEPDMRKIEVQVRASEPQSDAGSFVLLGFVGRH